MKKCAVIPAKDNRQTTPVRDFAVWIMKATEKEIAMNFTDTKGNNRELIVVIEIKELAEAMQHLGITLAIENAEVEE